MKFKGEEKEQMKMYRLLELLEVSPGCQKLAKKIRFEHFYLSDKELEEALIAKTPIWFNPLKPLSSPERVVESPLRKKLGTYGQVLKEKFIELCTKRQVEANFYLGE
jgi:hypothetical protein